MHALHASFSSFFPPLSPDLPIALAYCQAKHVSLPLLRPPLNTFNRHRAMSHRRHSLSAFSLFFAGDHVDADPDPDNELDVGPDPDPDPDPEPDPEFEFECPFGKIDSLSRADLREAAYELFFMSCRSSPGFGGGRASLSYFPTSTTSTVEDVSPRSSGQSAGLTMPKSRIKMALGLNARRASPLTTGRSSRPNSSGRVRRPMTSAEIMRQQMRVTEKSDFRLRKTLTRCLVGQGGKKAESIILPLELLRQLKPSEFNDMQQFHQWQRRQLRILEISVLLHPPFPFNPNHPAALRLQEIIQSTNLKPIDNSKNSDAMRSLSDCVLALAWHSPDSSTEMCHWVIGYPLCIHLYVALLHSIFDLREVTVVLDEVDELLELMKKTWPTLGIDRTIHNLCFTWLFFRQYIETGEVAPDLMSATLGALVEVANDAKSSGHDANYGKLFSATLGLMKDWAERRALNYHECFDAESASRMEQIVSLAVSTSNMVGDGEALIPMTSSEDRVDCYIRSSIRNAFTKILDNGSIQKDSIMIEVPDDTSNIMIQLAKETEKLAMSEMETFGPVLKTLHPIPTAVAAATIHTCFGIVLKQYLAKITSLTNELVDVLQAAGKLEKLLVQMAVEDSVDCDDGGKGIVTEMIPYDADSIHANLLRKWIKERLRIGQECLNKGKGSESWMPLSKNEPYAKSAVDLMKVAKMTVDEFFEIPAIGARDDSIQDLAVGLESIFHEYTAYVAGCGNKQSCLPTPPPLTRCNQGSSLVKLWKKAAVRCSAGASTAQSSNESSGEGSNPRPSTSRGTQRLYVRLNTLYYLLAHLHALDKSLSFFSYRGGDDDGGPVGARRLAPSYYFELACSEVESAIHHVAEVAAYRLIFLDTRKFYEGLYVDSVAEARIHPRLVILKQNLALMVSILIDRAQALAVKEVMKAAVEAFLMVLLAGGPERAFKRADHDSVVEDFWSLKEIFAACGDKLVTEDVVDRETEVAEGVVGLMGLPTETLLEDFKIAACIANGTGPGGDGEGRKLPMMSPTGKWNRADPNTLLRVLCHRDDSMANEFLKRTFQLPRRR